MIVKNHLRLEVCNSALGIEIKDSHFPHGIGNGHGVVWELEQETLQGNYTIPTF